MDTSCPQTLAAVNPARDTLVLVLLNEGEKVTHNIDLTSFGKLPKRRIKAYRTSTGENLASIRDGIRVRNKSLRVELPKQSITTLIIPVRETRHGVKAN